jgi:hypothetical protein
MHRMVCPWGTRRSNSLTNNSGGGAAVSAVHPTFLSTCWLKSRLHSTVVAS